MTSALVRLVTACACVLPLLVSRTPVTSPLPVVDSPAGRAPQDSFPARVVRELHALAAGGTFASWMQEHPNEAFERFVSGGPGNEGQDWCARATLDQTVPDRTGPLRHAYFYPPPLSPSSTLPAPATPAGMAQQCVLGAVRTDNRSQTDAAGRQLAEETRAALALAYGSSPDTASRELPFGLAARSSVFGRWQIDSMVVATAYEPGFMRSASRVTVLAYLPVSELGEWNPYRHSDQREASLLAEALELSGLGQALGAPLLSVLAQAESTYSGKARIAPDTLKRRTMTALRDWLGSARTLDAGRRAAALLAADRVLGNSSVGFPFSRDGAAFKALGAGFGCEYHNDGCVYTHTWLTQALRLDPNGRPGTLAFMTLLRSRFDTAGSCSSGERPYQVMIRRGELFMTRLTDSTFRTELHLTLGNAWADSVAMTHREHGADAPQARAKALQHYRAGLESDRSSILAHQAWRTVWRLLAGLPPRGVLYYCDND